MGTITAPVVLWPRTLSTPSQFGGDFPSPPYPLVVTTETKKGAGHLFKYSLARNFCLEKIAHVWPLAIRCFLQLTEALPSVQIKFKLLTIPTTMNEQTIILSQDATEQLVTLQREKFKKVLECKRIDAKIRRASFLGLKRANERRLSGVNSKSSCKRHRPPNPYARKKVLPSSHSICASKLPPNANQFQNQHRGGSSMHDSSAKLIDDGDDYLRGVDLSKLFASFEDEPPPTNTVRPVYHDTYETPFAPGFTVWKSNNN